MVIRRSLGRQHLPGEVSRCSRLCKLGRKFRPPRAPVGVYPPLKVQTTRVDLDLVFSTRFLLAVRSPALVPLDVGSPKGRADSGGEHEGRSEQRDERKGDGSHAEAATPPQQDQLANRLENWQGPRTYEVYAAERFSTNCSRCCLLNFLSWK